MDLQPKSMGSSRSGFKNRGSQDAASGQSCSPCPQAPCSPPLEQVWIHLAEQFHVGGCCVCRLPLGMINQGQNCWILGWETFKESTSTTKVVLIILWETTPEPEMNTALSMAERTFLAVVVTSPCTVCENTQLHFFLQSAHGSASCSPHSDLLRETSSLSQKAQKRQKMEISTSTCKCTFPRNWVLTL